MRKISILMALLITGYILGIWNFLLMPKYYIAFGLKGILISLGLFAAGIVLIFSELEATKRTRYLLHEFMVKVARLPAVTLVLLSFLFLSGSVTLYLSSRALLEAFGLSPKFIIPVILGVIITILVLLVVLKGHSVEFIGAMAVLFVLFVLVGVFLLRGHVYGFIKSPEAMNQMKTYLHAIFSTGGKLSWSGVAFMGVTLFLSLGLGAGVYYVIGTFAPADLEVKKLLGAVVLLQIILSVAAALTVVYSLGAAYQSYEDNQRKYEQVHEELATLFSNPNLPSEQALAKYKQLTRILRTINQTLTNFEKVKTYASSGSENPIKAVETFYLIPDIIRESKLRGASTIVFLLMGSLFLAGFTTLIVLVEIGTQITGEVFQMRRTTGVSFVSASIAVLSAAMSAGGIKILVVVALFSIGAIVVAVEALPLIRGVSPVDRRFVGISTILSFILGILGIRAILGFGGQYTLLGLLLGILVLAPLVFNGYLMGSARRR